MIITPLIFYGCKFLSGYLRVRGESAANSARRFIAEGCYPGINSDGYFTTNAYTHGNRGVKDRISPLYSDNRVALPGYFKTEGEGIFSYEKPIQNPATIYTLLAEFVDEILVPVAIYLLDTHSKIKHIKNETSQFNTTSVSIYTSTPEKGQNKNYDATSFFLVDTADDKTAQQTFIVKNTDASALESAA